jgi:hypothetical protein
VKMPKGERGNFCGKKRIRNIAYIRR